MSLSTLSCSRKYNRAVLMGKEKAQIVAVRSIISDIYVYFSWDLSTRKRQIQLRKERQGVSDELSAAVILFFSTLNEKQRRLYAGLESAKLGHGGDRRLSQILDMDVHTVAKGRQELLFGGIDIGEVRDVGGGRKRIKKSPRRN